MAKRFKKDKKMVIGVMVRMDEIKRVAKIFQVPSKEMYRFLKELRSTVKDLRYEKQNKRA